jgi:hypothetical protein
MLDDVVEFAKENPWTTAGLVATGVLYLGPSAAVGTAIGVARFGSYVGYRILPSIGKFIQRRLAPSTAKTGAKFTERVKEAAQASRTKTVPKTQRIGEGPTISKAKVAGSATLGGTLLLDSLLS